MLRLSWAFGIASEEMRNILPRYRRRTGRIRMVAVESVMGEVWVPAASLFDRGLALRPGNCQSASTTGQVWSIRTPHALNLIIALEHRFFRTPDGSYWSSTVYPRPYWSRYLSVFDRLSILARVHDAPHQLDTWRRV